MSKRQAQNKKVFNKVALAYNLHKDENIKIVKAAGEILLSMGISTVELGMSQIEPLCLSKDSMKDIDLVAVFGGDGTLLSVARSFANSEALILGFNTGNLGFLSEAQKTKTKTELKKVFDDVLNGKYKEDFRSMLSAESIHSSSNNKKRPQSNSLLFALNEISISRSSRSSVLNFDLELNDNLIAKYVADGLIICTPTGSTAYALAAGGAVLSPKIEAFQIVPVCAHTLASRPLVVSDSSKVRVRVRPKNTKQSLITLQADAQETVLLEDGDYVEISKSPYKARLIRSLDPENDFYKVLSRKLFWGVTNAI